MNLRGWLKRLYYFFRRHEEAYRTKWLVDYVMRDLDCSKPGTLMIDNWQVHYINACDLRSMWRLQFGQRYNDFYNASVSPRILDCGSNIGVSVLRYKYLYPNSRVTAFEPDPELCATLRRNVVTNELDNVEVVEAAVWTTETTLGFLAKHHGSTQAGHLMQQEGMSTPGVFAVKTIWLGNYLDEHVDFLKLDIEGAEIPVLQSCITLLHNVEQLMVEVHYDVDEPQMMVDILSLLKEAGFKVAVYQHMPMPLTYKPYVKDPNSVADQFPVLWAWR